MVNDHSDSEREREREREREGGGAGIPLPPHRLLFPISSKGYFICMSKHTG